MQLVITTKRTRKELANSDTHNGYGWSREHGKYLRLNANIELCFHDNEDIDNMIAKLNSLKDQGEY